MARILIVEDEAHTVAVMSLWLKQHGYEVVEAANGAEALEILCKESAPDRPRQGGEAGADRLEAGPTGERPLPVDLIISDVNMPQGDGLELAKAVREKCGLEVPFIMLTSRCDQSALAKEMEPYDVQLYPKPFMPSRLVAQIGRLLGAVTS